MLIPHSLALWYINEPSTLQFKDFLYNHVVLLSKYFCYSQDDWNHIGNMGYALGGYVFLAKSEQFHSFPQRMDYKILQGTKLIIHIEIHAMDDSQKTSTSMVRSSKGCPYI